MTIGNAIKITKIKGAKIIGLTGSNGGRLNGVCDVLIKTSGSETYKIQQLHLIVYHIVCVAVEMEFYLC